MHINQSKLFFFCGKKCEELLLKCEELLLCKKFLTLFLKNGSAFIYSRFENVTACELTMLLV